MPAVADGSEIACREPMVLANASSKRRTYEPAFAYHELRAASAT